MTTKKIVLEEAPRSSRFASPWVMRGLIALAVAIPLLIVGAIALVNVQMNGGSATSSRLLSPGMTAPDFSADAQDGRTFHLADYKGRAVFLAFVPDWESGETRQEARSLAASTRDFDMAGAKVFLVGASGDTTQAKALHDREKLPFPLLLDSNGSLTKRFTVSGGRRTTFVVDPAGKVKFRVSLVETARHGKQLVEVSKCCLEDVIAARAKGIGKPVGDFSLPRAIDGKMETIFGDHTQKATVVLFISAKCPCSNSYNERLRELAQAYPVGSGVRIVGVYANQDETAGEIAAHAKAHGFFFPILRDDRKLSAADHFQASVTPETFLMDSNGVLRYQGRIDTSREPAEVTTHDLQEAIAAQLSGKPLPAATRAFGCAIVRGGV